MLAKVYIDASYEGDLMAKAKVSYSVGREGRVEFKESIAGKVINLRIRTALDVSRSNMMLADVDYNIIYMNGTLQHMLREAEPEITEAAFDEYVAGWVAGNIEWPRRMLGPAPGESGCRVPVAVLKTVGGGGVAGSAAATARIEWGAVITMVAGLAVPLRSSSQF